MNSEGAFPAFPVIGWQVGAVDNAQGVVMKFGYSTAPGGPGASVFDSQFFDLSPEQVRSLIYDLERCLHQCEDKVA